MLVCGVDGCPAGWIAVWLNADGGQARISLYPTFAAMTEEVDQAALVLVDVPIGLPSNCSPRSCDLEARKILRPHGSRVFPAPSRQAVATMGRVDRLDIKARFRVVSDANYQATGRKLTWQTFAIMPKIGELDIIMLLDSSIQERIRETHPEVCFAALNDWKAVAERKTTPLGKKRRHQLLSLHLSQAEEVVRNTIVRFRRDEVQEHDVLDALAAAVTAKSALNNGIPTLPPSPEFDNEGLRMEMVLPLAYGGDGTNDRAS